MHERTELCMYVYAFMKAISSFIDICAICRWGCEQLCRMGSIVSAPREDPLYLYSGSVVGNYAEEAPSELNRTTSMQELRVLFNCRLGHASYMVWCRTARDIDSKTSTKRELTSMKLGLQAVLLSQPHHDRINRAPHASSPLVPHCGAPRAPPLLALISEHS